MTNHFSSGHSESICDDFVAHRFSFQYIFLTPRFRYVLSPERTFGAKLPDGSWTGMMGMIVREVSETNISQRCLWVNLFCLKESFIQFAKVWFYLYCYVS